MGQIMAPAFIIQMFGNGFLLNLTSSGKQAVQPCTFRKNVTKSLTKSTEPI